MPSSDNKEKFCWDQTLVPAKKNDLRSSSRCSEKTHGTSRRILSGRSRPLVHCGACLPNFAELKGFTT